MEPETDSVHEVEQTSLPPAGLGHVTLLNPDAASRHIMDMARGLDAITARKNAARYVWLRQKIDHGPLALCEQIGGVWSPIRAYCEHFVDDAMESEQQA